MNLDVRLTEIFRNVFGDETIVLDDHIRSSSREDWDSIANLNLMFAVEQEFGITFGSSEFSKLDNVGELKQAIKVKRIA